LLADGEGEHGADRLHGRVGDGLAIQPQERTGRDPGRALVAIDERMVTRQAEGIGGGKRGTVILALFPTVVRPGQRRIPCTVIAQSHDTAMLGELPIVEG
jgi:hypothetical protein